MNSPDLLVINQYKFSLKKYNTEDQRQSVIKRLNQIITKTNSSASLYIPSSSNRQAKSFLCENLTQFDGKQWLINHQQQYSGFYQHIPTILFTNTTVINLAHCNITNIQLFGYLQAPNLHTLELFQNHIMTIKPLAKNNQFTQMQNLTLYRNCITDFFTLFRSRANLLIYFQLEIQRDDKVVCEDITVFQKVPARRRGQKLRFWNSSQERIPRAISKKIDKFKGRSRQ